MELGDVVIVALGGGTIIGIVTAIRIGWKATTGMKLKHDRPETPLPDYIEIDGHIQVNPEKVRKHE